MTELDTYVKGITKTENAAVERYRAEVKKVLEEVLGGETEEPFTIDDEGDYVFAGEFLKHVKKQKANLEKNAEDRAAPLKQALKLVRELDKDVIEKWGKVETYLKGKISEYTLAQIKAKEAAAAQIAAAAKAQDFDAAHEASTKLAQIPTPEVAGVSTVNVWVVDEEKVDISKAPREFLTLDWDVVKAYIKEFGKGQPKDLPGIPFKLVVRVRGSKG